MDFPVFSVGTVACSMYYLSILLKALERKAHDVRFGEVRFLELTGDSAATHHENAVAHSDDLDEIGGNKHHRQAVGCQFVNQPVNFRFRADVDTSSGLVKQDHSTTRAKPFGKHHLLLIATGEAAHGRLNVAHLDGEPFGQSLDRLSSAFFLITPKRPRKRRRMAMVAFSRIGSEMTHSLVLSIFRYQTDALTHSISRRVNGDAPAVERYRAAVFMFRAERLRGRFQCGRFR